MANVVTIGNTQSLMSGYESVTVSSILHYSTVAISTSRYGAAVFVMAEFLGVHFDNKGGSDTGSFVLSVFFWFILEADKNIKIPRSEL